MSRGFSDSCGERQDHHCDVLFVMSALGVGGSEKKIARITSALAGAARTSVAALGPPYTLRSAFARSVRVATLDRTRRISPRVIARLRALLVAGQPRTAIAVDLFAYLYLWIASRGAPASGTRIIALINTTTFVRLRDRLFIVGYARLLRSADLLVFGSLRQREEWVRNYRLGAVPACVIHNGVDTSRFDRTGLFVAGAARVRIGVPADAFTFGSVGRLAPEKNQVALVRTLAALRRSGADAHLLLAGDGPMREAIMAEAQELGVTAQLRLVGEVEEVRDVLAALDVFVLPSTSVETFSNAALEAMAMSVPVVLSDIGGAREMVTSGVEGLVIPPGDQVALDQALQALQGDAAQRAMMAAAARHRVVRDFAFDGMIEAYRAIVAGEKPAAGPCMAAR